MHLSECESNCPIPLRICLIMHTFLSVFLRSVVWQREDKNLACEQALIVNGTSKAVGEQSESRARPPTSSLCSLKHFSRLCSSTLLLPQHTRTCSRASQNWTILPNVHTQTIGNVQRLHLKTQLFIALSRVDIWKRSHVPSDFCGRGKRWHNSSLEVNLLILDASSK